MSKFIRWVAIALAMFSIAAVLTFLASEAFAAMPTTMSGREYNKFTTDASGNTAIRIIMPDGGAVGATTLTGLSDIGSATATAGRLLIADGTDFQSVALSGSCTITSAGVITCAAGGASGVTAGSYNAANLTVNTNGVVTFAAQGQLTSLSDVTSSTKTAGNILIANGTNFASATLSGSCTVTSAGVMSCIDTGATQLTGLSDVASATKTAGNILIANGTNFASIAVGGDVTLSSAGSVSNLKVQQGAAPTISAAGNIGVDTTDDQLKYYGAAVRTLPYERTICTGLESLAATDDNYAFYMANDAITVTGVGCNCRGTCTPTLATFTLEDRGGNAMTITGTNPTCATTGAATFAAVTAGNTLTAGEMMAFNVSNTPTTGDTYVLCVTTTVDAQ